jgi:hypothetical protein
VDKYTRWEFELTDKGRTEEPGNPNRLSMFPSKNWGGDPLRSVLEPSFVPRRIKGMYKDEDKVILNMVDVAFRPIDFIGQDGSLVPASMVGQLKNYSRYSDALWAFIGGSRATGIPAWTKDTMGTDLPNMAELLDQVCSSFKDGDNYVGKELVGVIMSRVLQCKALATAMESQRPGFKENLSLLFDTEGKTRPFMEVMQFLWGSNLDAKSGFLNNLAGGRTRVVFEGIKETERSLQDTWDILQSNDQDPKGRGKKKVLNRVGFVLDMIQATNKNFGRR